MSKQKIIILNGTSSAGKTSVAKNLIEQAPITLNYVQWDSFFQSNLEGSNLLSLQDYEKNFLALAFRQHASQILKNGQNVLMDVVCVPAQNFQDLAYTFNDHALTTVRLKASIEVLKIRENERYKTDRRIIGMAKEQYHAMYNLENHTPYNLELNSDEMTPNELSSAILGHLRLQN